MILGIGMDLVHIEGMVGQLADHASGFVPGTFTPQELRTARQRPSQDTARHLAVRFAAKEAFIKAWSCANRGRAPALAHVDMRQVEVVQDAYGRPALTLHGEIAQLITQLGDVQLHLSLSHDGPMASAVVILEEVPSIH